MRWKLLIIAALLAALVGALPLLLGFYSGLFGLMPYTWRVLLFKPNIKILSFLILPIAAITYSSIFVYRHNARRRALQASLTALLAILLTLTFLKIGAMLLDKWPRSNYSSLVIKPDV